MQNNSLELLKEKLKEMFQFQNNDLNFGIFKIYKLKQKEIEKFIDEKLEDILKKELKNVSNLEEKSNLLELELFLKGFQKTDLLEDINKNYEKINSLINNFGNGNTQKLKDILQSQRVGNIEGDLENKIYNYILNFFELYYSEGDFGYNTRSLNTYKVEYDEDYNGSDIMFHWKHKGSYYIKSANGFNSIKFDLQNKNVETRFIVSGQSSLSGQCGQCGQPETINKLSLHLETNEESEGEEQSQNNNRETEFKHYKLNRIERIPPTPFNKGGEEESILTNSPLDKGGLGGILNFDKGGILNLDKGGIFKIIFNLSKTSTSKEEIYKTIFKEILNINLDDNFLYTKEGKSIFNSLTKDFGQIQNGNIKGFSQLKIKKEDLIKKYNSNVGKQEKINKSFDELDENNQIENIILTLWSLDNKLNSFYIGNDSDFFIHKDLKGFLTKEKEKFIKNNILGDLNTILNAKTNNTTLVIAKTFNQITSEIIDFLSAIEEFQKGIFESKKKVLVSEYCITLNKIDKSFYDEILQNKAQIEEWKNLGFIETPPARSSLPPQLRGTEGEQTEGEQIELPPTLSIDTKFFSQDFKDRLLNSFDDLEKQTNGILINSENFQALNLLKNKYRGKVKCIYIDPPYNTGGDGFVYKDTFKHSSWLSMMENRLTLAREFLSEDGVIFVSIDDNEQDNLKKLMDQVFRNENFVANFTWIRKKKGSFLDKKVRKMTEFILCFQKKENNNKFFGENAYSDKYQPIVKRTNKEKELIFEKLIVKTTLRDGFYKKGFYGNNETGINFLNDFEVKNSFIINNFKCIGKFVWTQDFLDNELKNGTKVELSSKFGFNVLRFNQDEKTKTPSTIITSENNVGTNEDATNEIQYLFGGEIGTIFSYNKPTSLIKYLINFNTNPNDIILDFFAGSGTTQHAVIELNKEDGGNRKYIGVEMGEYFDTVTKPRIQKVIYTSHWKDGKPIPHVSPLIRGESEERAGGFSQIFKYQILEQYEDILDKLEIDSEDFPLGLDLKYLYKKEEIKLKSTLNLRKPFENTYIYGKTKKQTKIDLIETYNYIKGNNIESIKTFEIKNKYYKVVKTHFNVSLQIWRNIEQNENDLENIKEIVKKYDDIDTIEVNVEIFSLERDKFGQLEINGKKYDIEIIDM